MKKLNEINVYENNLNNTHIAVQHWEKEKCKERTKIFQETLGLCLDYVTPKNNKPVKLKQPNLKATPVFYMDVVNTSTKDVLNKWSDLGYKNIKDVADEKGISVDAQFNKATWNGNLHTGIILFNISRFMQRDLTKIYRAIVNNKLVNVRTPKGIFRNVKLNTIEWFQIEEMFNEAKQEYIKKKQKQNNAFKLEQIKSTLGNLQVNEKQGYIIDALAYFYELDEPKTDTDYTVTWATVQAYLNAHIPFSKDVTEHNEDRFKVIPQAIGKICTRFLFSFRDVEVESYGNFDIAQSKSL